jgi:hypothetical protein
MKISLGVMFVAGSTMLGFLFGEAFALRCNGELARLKLFLAYSASFDHETHLLLVDRLTWDGT